MIVNISYIYNVLKCRHSDYTHIYIYIYMYYNSIYMVPKKCDANHVNNINNIPYYIITIIVLQSAAGILCGYPQWFLLPHSHNAPIRNPCSSWEVYGPGVPPGNRGKLENPLSIPVFLVFSWENWQKINGGFSSHGADDTSDGIPKCVDDLSSLCYPKNPHEISPWNHRDFHPRLHLCRGPAVLRRLGDVEGQAGLALQLTHLAMGWWLDPWKMVAWSMKNGIKKMKQMFLIGMCPVYACLWSMK